MITNLPHFKHTMTIHRARAVKPRDSGNIEFKIALVSVDDGGYSVHRIVPNGEDEMLVDWSVTIREKWSEPEFAAHVLGQRGWSVREL